MRLCATSFISTPAITYGAILLIAYVAGRRPFWFSALAVLVMTACVATLAYSIITLRRSSYHARWIFIILNAVILILSCCILALLFVALAAELAA